MTERRFGRRLVVATFVAAAAVAVFAVIGGAGLAGELANPGNAQYGAGGQYHGKVTICHKGWVTIRVAWAAWFRAHERHGDTMGPCSAAAVKAGKLKAAKLKAAKLEAKKLKAAKHGKGKAAAKSQETSTDSGSETSEQGTPPGHGQGNANGHGNGHGKNG